MESEPTPLNSSKKPIPLRRRLIYVSLIYVFFLGLLALVEVITRVAMTPISSSQLLVATPQQRMQVSDPKQAGIFEGDPLLLWRLKPNLNHAVWDFTVLSTNAQHFRADYPIENKPPGTYRIVCLGDSVTFGYRVPVVWPDKPTEYDPEWLPFPILLEKQLRAANLDRQVEVFPMAVPGYTSHQGLAWLRRDIDRLQPDLLTVSFGWNEASFRDIPDSAAIKTNWRAVTVRWLVDHSQTFAHATHWLRARQSPSGKAFRPAPRVSEQDYLNNMMAVAQLGRQKGAPVIIL